MTLDNALFLAIGAGIVAILYGAISVRWILAQPAGNERMQEIAAAIQAGARAYLNRQYRTIAIVGVILFVILGLALGWATAGGFAVGAILSALAGYIGMSISVRANVRTAQAAHLGIDAALKVAFRGGAITGMLVVGLGLIGVAGYYLGMLHVLGDAELALRSLVGLAFGGSLISIFARLGGGIFTKGADVGADLVGKVEAGIPEDDPRNPAVITDNVGDNVGDFAGMAADLSKPMRSPWSPRCSGRSAHGRRGQEAVLFSAGARRDFHRVLDHQNVFRLHQGRRQDHECPVQGVIVSGLISTVAFYFVSRWFMAAHATPMWLCTLIGLALTAAMIVITEYYTATRCKPGAARGLGIPDRPCDQHHCRPRCLDEGVRIAGDRGDLEHLGLLSARRARGIAIAATAMLSMTGMIVALDAYGASVQDRQHRAQRSCRSSTASRWRRWRCHRALRAERRPQMSASNRDHRQCARLRATPRGRQ